MQQCKERRRNHSRHKQRAQTIASSLHQVVLTRHTKQARLAQVFGAQHVAHRLHHKRHSLASAQIPFTLNDAPQRLAKQLSCRLAVVAVRPRHAAARPPSLQATRSISISSSSSSSSSSFFLVTYRFNVASSALS